MFRHLTGHCAVMLSMEQCLDREQCVDRKQCVDREQCVDRLHQKKE